MRLGYRLLPQHQGSPGEWGVSARVCRGRGAYLGVRALELEVLEFRVFLAFWGLGLGGVGVKAKRF